MRYSVAMSLDGYIATSDGGYDWIPDDPGVDFAAFLSNIDTLLMGRSTYELGIDPIEGPFASMAIHVFSTTLDPSEHPRVTIVSENAATHVAELKQTPGKDIWLFGGGQLFRSLVEAGVVDTVEVAVVPALLGDGVPLVPGLNQIVSMDLHSVEEVSAGMLLVKYHITGFKS